MKKIIIALGLLIAASLPSFAQKVDSKALSDGCLTPEEWAVSMAAQGLSPIGTIELVDGFFQYYLIDAEKELYLLFPFDLKGCGIMTVAPVAMTAVELKNTFGIVIS